MLLWVCFFTFLIHMTESLAYTMRLVGVRTRQIAIAMSFVTSTLLISRLSNMCQAPFLGLLVDYAILDGSQGAIDGLIRSFRMVILAASFGVLMGMFLTPMAVSIFRRAITRFLKGGSLPGLILYGLRPSSILKGINLFKLPRLMMFRGLVWKALPKGFLMANIGVASIHCIGVLCALLAGALFPDFRSTAIQLSGIVNGIATVLLTMFVDPPGARVTDEAVHGKRSEDEVRSVVFFMQLGKLFGILIVSQLLLVPLARYIVWVTAYLTGL
eukprot:COSAG01_NODE_2_length_63927_cov_1357.611941_46_plen_271_part_00